MLLTGYSGCSVRQLLGLRDEPSHLSTEVCIVLQEPTLIGSQPLQHPNEQRMNPRVNQVGAVSQGGTADTQATQSPFPVIPLTITCQTCHPTPHSRQGAVAMLMCAFPHSSHTIIPILGRHRQPSLIGCPLRRWNCQNLHART